MVFVENEDLVFYTVSATQMYIIYTSSKLEKPTGPESHANSWNLLVHIGFWANYSMGENTCELKYWCTLVLIRLAHATLITDAVVVRTYGGTFDETTNLLFQLVTCLCMMNSGDNYLVQYKIQWEKYNIHMLWIELDANGAHTIEQSATPLWWKEPWHSYEENQTYIHFSKIRLLD